MQGAAEILAQRLAGDATDTSEEAGIEQIDLSWLPGGQPEVFTHVTSSLGPSRRLPARRHTNLESVLGMSTETAQVPLSNGGHANHPQGIVSMNGVESGSCDNSTTSNAERVAQEKAAVPVGTFVRRYGQQTLSNTTWALATFDTEGISSAEEAIEVCNRLFCNVPAADVQPQVCCIACWAHRSRIFSDPQSGRCRGTYRRAGT
jgi:hypothetical protein